jgi:hypothetical protein
MADLLEIAQAGKPVTTVDAVGATRADSRTSGAPPRQRTPSGRRP